MASLFSPRSLIYTNRAVKTAHRPVRRNEADRAGDEEVEDREEEEVAEVEDNTRERIEGEPRCPVEQAIREQPERAATAC